MNLVPAHLLVRVRLPDSPDDNETVFTIPFAINPGAPPTWILPVREASLGVHVYSTYWSGGITELCIRVSNGAVNPNGTGFAGEIEVRELAVLLNLSEPNLTLEDVRLLGAPSFTATGEGNIVSLNIITEKTRLTGRSIFIRRAAFGGTAEERENVLFCIPGRLSRCRLLPTMVPIDAPGQATLLEEINLCRSLEKGRAGLADLNRYFPGLEFYQNRPHSLPFPHEWIGGADAGEVGGAGIEMIPGWEAMPGLRRMLHDVAMSRMAVAAYDRRTGEPVQRWITPFEYRLSRSPIGKLTAPPWAVNPPANQYEDNRTYKAWNCPTSSMTALALPFDGQHLVRGFRHGLASLSWTADRTVLEDLNMILWDARYSWTDNPQPDSPYWKPFSLKQVAAAVEAAAGTGHPEIGREFGWVLTLACAVAHYYPTQHVDFVQRMAETAAKAQMSNGMFQRLTYGSFFGAPSPWTDYGCGVEYEVAQGIEHSIVAHAMAAATHVVQVRQINYAASFATLTGLGGDLHNKRYPNGGQGKVITGPIGRWMIVKHRNRRVLNPAVRVESSGTENFNIWCAYAAQIIRSDRRSLPRVLAGARAYMPPDIPPQKIESDADLLAALRACPHQHATRPLVLALESRGYAP